MGKEALHRSAELFGYEAPEPREEVEAMLPPPPESTFVDTVPTRAQEDAKPRIDPAKARFARLLKRESVPEEERRTEAPARLAETEPLPENTMPELPLPVPAMPPLAPWRRLWPFLRTALGSEGFSHRIDLPRLVNGLARGHSFRRLPRLRRQGWAASAQVVVDQSLGLYPFWEDFEELIEGLGKLRGRAGLEIVGFRDGPLGEATPWGKYGERPYRPPEPGVPVLILGDLGYLDGRQQAWLALGRRLKEAGFRPVALMPCPPRYWDHELAEYFHPVVWDRNRRLPRRLDSPAPRPETAAPDPGLEQLLRLLAHAVRVEPGLLRALRYRLGADAVDVGTEAAIWRHRDVRDDGLSFALAHERQEHYRAAAAQEYQKGDADARALYGDAAELLRTWHAGLHPAIAAEEALMYAQSLGIEPDQGTLEFFWRVAATLDRPGGYPHLQRLRAWVRRMADRQSREMWRWESAEPLAIAVAKVLVEGEREIDDLSFPPGFDSNRVMWILQASEPALYELRQENMSSGEKRLVLKPPGGAVADGAWGRGDALIATFTMNTHSLQWQHLDQSGKPGPAHLVDIRRDREIPLPPQGSLQIWGSHERVVIDGLECPSWAARIEQGRGPQGEDLFSVRPKGRPDLPLFWLPAAAYPLLGRDGGVIGTYEIREGFFLREDEYREILRQGFRQPEWAERFGVDEYGLYADFSVKDITQRMRWIPPGTFLMGSPENEPERRDGETQHQVTLTEGFWLGETTVTQALWQVVMEDDPSRFKGPERPVEQVSWEDAQAFMERLNRQRDDLGLRLPREAEWEYACRAGTTTPFCFGDNITPEQVNYDGNHPYAGGEKGLYRRETVEVKALPCNGWGLYQMHGNVYEWCEDWHGGYPAEPVVDPEGPSAGSLRVLRGSSWISIAGFCRSAVRDGARPVNRFNVIGFRLARGRKAG